MTKVETIISSVILIALLIFNIAILISLVRAIFKLAENTTETEYPPLIRLGVIYFIGNMVLLAAVLVITHKGSYSIPTLPSISPWTILSCVFFMIGLVSLPFDIREERYDQVAFDVFLIAINTVGFGIAIASA